MTSITITLSDDRLAKLNELANRLGITADDIIRISLDEMLADPDVCFEQVVDHVLIKNAALYCRLAK